VSRGNNCVLVKGCLDRQLRWAGHPRDDTGQAIGMVQGLLRRRLVGWSPPVERMHGYRPGTVAPGTALVLSHVHLDDYQHVAAAFDQVRRAHTPLISRRRIIDAHSRVHDVVVVGAPFYDARGALVGMHGCYLNVTPALPAASLAPAENYERVAQRLRVTAAGGQSEQRRLRIRAATPC
jgi:PAS fold